MHTAATRNAFPHPRPEFGTVYGDFAKGTARKVFMQRISHIQESHNRACVAAAVGWMQQALNPPPMLWLDPHDQTWPLKETMTLVAMLACFACALPLSLVLLQTDFFGSLRGPVQSTYSCTPRSYRHGALVNGVLMNALIVTWLFASSQVIAPIP